MSSSGPIVICGGGIIGASVAYHLAQLGRAKDVTVVEATGVACAASGFAGGFLARSWCSGTATDELARVSFDMYETLVATLAKAGHCVDYRRLNTIGVELFDARDGADAKPKAKRGTKRRAGVDTVALPEWVDASCVKQGPSVMGTTKDTAQVHPRKLTKALMAEAVRQGVTLVKATVTGLELTGTASDAAATATATAAATTAAPSVTGVHTSSGTLKAAVVVLALGPWLGKAMKWLSPHCKLQPIYGGKAHSVTFVAAAKDDDDDTGTTPASGAGGAGGGAGASGAGTGGAAGASTPPAAGLPTMATAVFADYADIGGGVHGGSNSRSPEIYPRPDGEVYICGESDKSALPDNASLVQPSAARCETLAAFGRRVVPLLRPGSKLQLHRKQACFLPYSPDGAPVIGAAPGVQGAFIAGGHSCWGILQSPATGLAMAQLIAQPGKPSCVDLRPFSPGRAALQA